MIRFVRCLLDGYILFNGSFSFQFYGGLRPPLAPHGGLCPLSYGTKIEMENGKWKMKYKRIKKQK